MKLRKAIPWSMIAARATLGPTLAIVARQNRSELWLGIMIVAGFLSDVFDGILARHWKTDTDSLRLADSAVDIVFYSGILAAIIQRHWPALRDRAWLLLAVIALEAGCKAFEWIKFRRIGSYHTYSAKFWGILLAGAAFSLLCLNRASWILTGALVWGIVCNLECLTLSLMLHKWHRVVKTIFHGLVLRRRMIV